MEEFSTPMMKQYKEIKKNFPDCLLFYRMGDFYELFMDDAHIGAKVLDITLTSKAGGKDGKIPMAGVPFHAVDSYLTKLIRAGYKVAICEQVSEPHKYGLVDREVVRIVSPGTVFDEKSLEKKENNFIICLAENNKYIALAVADISTGVFQVDQFELNYKNSDLLDQIARLHPAECILPQYLYDSMDTLKLLKQQINMNIYCFQDWNIYVDSAEKLLKKQFGIQGLFKFDYKKNKVAREAAAALLGYLMYTQKDKVTHFTTLSSIQNQNYMNLDRSTVLNLELFNTIRDQDRKGTVIDSIDETRTAMGGRKIREWLRTPLTNHEEIIKRYDAVSFFYSHREQRIKMQILLEGVQDIERVLARLSVGIGNARDLINLSKALGIIIGIKKYIDPAVPVLREVYESITPEVERVISTIDTHILSEPPIDLRNGGMIQKGIDNELDELRILVNKNKSWIVEFEKQERERTGIATLKVKFNRVFGFYIEVSKSNTAAVPSNYLRKQTLVNGERFITHELKEKEELILTAEEKINLLEFQLFTKILKDILAYTAAIQNAAQAIAILDTLINFASISDNYNYVRPQLTENGDIIIKQGRHVVVERLLENSSFVPNDITLSQHDHQLLILTGPNMAGKSVLARQTALIVLLAQIGCFVPAQEVIFTPVDHIFVRSGASDVITAGLSTFMVEMVETAQILENATKNSLIVMDEIGRGTSTYDGISIAWAIAEYLVTHKKITPKTLFATHYHELQTLENQHPQKIKNYHMAIEKFDGEPVFLHTLVRGSAAQSYGISVAKLAGLPNAVIERAYILQRELEKSKSTIPTKMDTEKFENQNTKNEKIVKNLQKININSLTPLEALNILSEIKSKIER